MPLPIDSFLVSDGPAAANAQVTDDSLGKIPLQNATFYETPHKKKFSFEIQTGDRIFYLMAADGPTVSKWMVSRMLSALTNLAIPTGFSSNYLQGAFR